MTDATLRGPEQGAPPAAPAAGGEVALTEKQKLEIDKLKAEIEELTVRARNNHAQATREQSRKNFTNFVAWVGLVTGLVTLSAGGFGIFTQARNHFQQYDAATTTKLIALVDKLNKPDMPDTPSERESALLMLSTYESDAIPVLTWHLERVPTGDATLQAIRALRMQIVDKGKCGRREMTRFLASAESFFKREFQGGDRTGNAVGVATKYVRAMGEVLLCNSRAVTELLQQWKAVVADPKMIVGTTERPASMGVGDQSALLRLIDKQLAKVQS